MPSTRADIDDFLAQRRIAMVGVSRNPHDFSRSLFRELCARGYHVVPVNPSQQEIEGKKTFRRMQDIVPPVQAALIITAPAQTLQVVRDCVEAGVGRVWMHSGGGQGSVHPHAVEFCNANGIRLVEGHCPFMFLPKTALFHRFHGFVLKMAGRYPSAKAA
jgi:predicted CoA-binding protein